MNDVRTTFEEACRAADEQRDRELHGERPELPQGVTVNDFYAYGPQNLFIYKPNGTLWPTGTIDKRLGKIGRMKASTWLHRNHPVEQMTWMPGEPSLIKNKLVADGGWIEKHGVTVYNLYTPPTLEPGNPDDAGPWIDHVHKVYPDDADHAINWFAYRCQYPGIKINHGLVLGGNPGVGKDTILEPVRRAVGHWNCKTVSPTQLLNRFNGFLKSVILCISEARDLGDVNRPQFYEHTKQIMAAPPEVLLIDEKHTHEYTIPNLTGVVITTNYKAGGIYLPAEDRRHYVAWSPRTIADFSLTYWNRLWNWYEGGGFADVSAYLYSLDLRGFDPKAPPPKTPAFWEIVNASRPPEYTEMADALQALGYPDAVTLDRVIQFADPDFALWLKDRKNRRFIPGRFETCGYSPVRNPDADDGLWRISSKRCVPYALSKLTIRDQIIAVRKL